MHAFAAPATRSHLLRDALLLLPLAVVAAWWGTSSGAQGGPALPAQPRARREPFAALLASAAAVHAGLDAPDESAVALSQFQTLAATRAPSPPKRPVGMRPAPAPTTPPGLPSG